MKSAPSFLITLILLAVATIVIHYTVGSLTTPKQSAKTDVFYKPLPTHSTSPLAITTMQQKAYPGSQITVEQTLPDGSNYHRYIVSYISEGLKIYGLLTVPIGDKPMGGYPVILFNHGYIPPASFSPINNYQSMVSPLASSGYIVFMPNYRGNGNSEGIPKQPYVAPDDITDSLNALASIKHYKDANPNRIGVFGHSMGGNITLHELVITQDFKAAEILAGTVGSEIQLLDWWNQRFTNHSIVGNDLDTYNALQEIVKHNGTPQTNPNFWNSLDPTKSVSAIQTPIELQVGTADEDVPPNFSSDLQSLLQKNGKTFSYHKYPGADHNLAPATQQAMNETVIFFNKYLK